MPDALQRLWTPHRMAYIKGQNKPDGDDVDGCPFCALVELDDPDALIIARGEQVYGVLETQLSYLRTIGAIGPAAGPDSPFGDAGLPHG